MNGKTELEKVSEETMRFMRGKYAADEIGINKATDGGNADGLKFRRGGKTILTIYIYDDRYDFLVIFGKAEREKFEAKRDEFPKKIQDIYDNSKTYHDGKWMIIPVADLDTLEAVKQMIMIKKKPNRKPFPKENVVFCRQGDRCDLCIHYVNSAFSEEFHKDLAERIGRLYDHEPNYNRTCPGRYDGWCGKKECTGNKGLEGCPDCENFPCGNCGLVTCGIEASSISADDITWGVLPYVDGQYGN